MKDLEKYIADWRPESINESHDIDQAWLDNEKPVQTADGRNAVVLDIDISQVPNIIKGQVNDNGKMCDYEWEDDGTCKRATDDKGNPKKPDDGDKLVKAI